MRITIITAKQRILIVVYTIVRKLFVSFLLYCVNALVTALNKLNTGNCTTQDINNRFFYFGHHSSVEFCEMVLGHEPMEHWPS